MAMAFQSVRPRSSQKTETSWCGMPSDTTRSRIRFSPANILWAVAWTASHTRFLRARERQSERAVPQQERCEAGFEPQLVRQRLERQRSVPGRPLLFLFLPRYICGSFICQLSFPAAEHSTDFNQVFRKMSIFFIVERAYVPCKLKKEFYEVSAGSCSIKQRLFFGNGRVTRKKTVFDCHKKHVVNF